MENTKIREVYRQPLLVGNWKMNSLKRESYALTSGIVKYFAGIKENSFEIVICPPFPLLSEVKRALIQSKIKLGAQDCHEADFGAYTGDVSPSLLKNMGCKYVIVGHSERRIAYKEKNMTIKAKSEGAINAKLNPIICLGETLGQKESGKTLNIIRAQLRESIPSSANSSNTVIAYEPVWAIGSGKVPRPAQIQKVHASIRAELKILLNEFEAQRTRIIYGGSMNSNNGDELLQLADVDGGLIGSASLTVKSFCSIIKN